MFFQVSGEAQRYATAWASRFERHAALDHFSLDRLGQEWNQLCFQKHHASPERFRVDTPKCLTVLFFFCFFFLHLGKYWQAISTISWMLRKEHPGPRGAAHSLCPISALVMYNGGELLLIRLRQSPSFTRCSPRLGISSQPKGGRRGAGQRYALRLYGLSREDLC